MTHKEQSEGGEEVSKDKILYVKDAQKVLEEFGKMNKRTKELALATLMGMRMVAESEEVKKAM